MDPIIKAVFMIFLISLFSGYHNPHPPTKSKDYLEIQSTEIWTIVPYGVPQDLISIGNNLVVIYEDLNSNIRLLVLGMEGKITLNVTLDISSPIKMFGLGGKLVVVVGFMRIAIIDICEMRINYIIIKKPIDDVICLSNSSYGNAIAILTNDTICVYELEDIVGVKQLKIDSMGLSMAQINDTHIAILTRDYIAILSFQNDVSTKIQIPSIDKGAIIVCDYNNDGRPDFIVIGKGSEESTIMITDGGNMKKIEYFESCEKPVLADMDADGYTDLIFYCAGNIYIYDLARSKTRKIPISLPFAFLDILVVADVNCDKRLEIILSGGNHGMWIDSTQEEGTINPYPLYGAIIVADIDGDILFTWDIDSGGIKRVIFFENKSTIVYIGMALNVIRCIKLKEGGIYNIYWQGIPPSRNLAYYDSDYDQLSNPLEYNIGTRPDHPDTDYDTLPDGWEYMNNLNPLDPTDATLDNDNDGLNNIAEYKYGGDPWDSDTDDDGLSDYDEAQIGTDLRLNDTDGDGYSDGYEVFHGTDPLDPNDYPVPLVERYWWLLTIFVATIIALVAFFLKRKVSTRRMG